ncbi:hypothetical protein VIBNISOn1_190046 [Vibrio nigripulchritudo SOn1]|uniref:Uncharacterized protein n=1 Tax=Vibrio nigripulchritudo SOn1 TaxID=1238450 RepID=A0AAV2VQ43_9VIBR|nr:hypothetical protein [Vibrio nigripulchritudo]CCO46827.1 hypothetical protein VIBNISOn1_190046 [Vibrio nigripulchritudo SOn1]
MKFTDSIAAKGIVENNMSNIIENSSASVNPELVMNVDSFFSKLSHFHDQSLKPELQELVSNFGQPIFDFDELKVRAMSEVELEEMAAQMQLDNGMEI